MQWSFQGGEGGGIVRRGERWGKRRKVRREERWGKRRKVRRGEGERWGEGEGEDEGGGGGEHTTLIHEQVLYM